MQWYAMVTIGNHGVMMGVRRNKVFRVEKIEYDVPIQSVNKATSLTISEHVVHISG